MNWKRASLCVAFGFALAACVVPAESRAQAKYPDHPVKVVVGFTAGGGTDVAARVIAQKLSEATGQTFVVENRAGASGLLASEQVAKAPADGYTIMVGSQTTLAVAPALYKKFQLDVTKEFTGMAMIGVSPLVAVVNADSPIKSLKDLITFARDKNGTMNFASGGVGTGNHFSGELFRMLAGIDVVHIPYKGSGVGMNDVLAGQVQMMFINLLPAMPFVANGRLRGLGVTSAKRSIAAPDIPTIAESGFAGYQSTSWHGIVAPAKTPAPILRQLHAELAKITQQPDVKKRMAGQGTDVIGSTPEEFRKVIQTESVKWANVIKTAGIKPE